MYLGLDLFRRGSHKKQDRQRQRRAATGSPVEAACVPAKVLLRETAYSSSSPERSVVVVVFSSPLSRQVRSRPPWLRSPFLMLFRSNTPFLLANVSSVLAGFVKTEQKR